MATVGSILVNLSMGTASFAAGAKRAESITKNLGNNLKSNIAAGLGALGVTLSAGALTAGFMSTVKAMDDVGDAATNMGMSAGELQKLHYAAEQNGASIEAMDTGLRKMQKTLGDAARDGGPAAETIQELGLNIDELLQMSPEQQFGAFSDALKKVENDALRASVTTDIFGKGGQELTATLALGSAGLAEFGSRAEKMGIVMSSIDATNIDNLANTMNTTHGIFSGIAQTVTSVLTPGINELMTGFNDWAMSGDGVKGKITSAMESIAMSGAKVIDIMALVKESIENVVDANINSKLGQKLLPDTGAFGEGVKRTFANVVNPLSAISDMFGAIDKMAGTNLKKNMDDVTEGFDILASEGAATKRVKQYFEDLKESQGEQDEANAKSKASNLDLGKSMIQLGKDQKKRDDALAKQAAEENERKAAQDADDIRRRGFKVYEETRSPMQEHADRLLELKRLYEADAISALTYDSAIRKATASLYDQSHVDLKGMTVGSREDLEWQRMIADQGRKQAFIDEQVRAVRGEVKKGGDSDTAIMAKQLEEFRKSATWLERIGKAIDSGGLIALEVADS